MMGGKMKDWDKNGSNDDESDDAAEHSLPKNNKSSHLKNKKK